MRSPDESFRDYLTIKNPKLRHDESGEWIPELRLPVTHVHEYYRTRTNCGAFTTGSFIRASTYTQKNYSNSGLDLSVDVVNRVTAFLESETELSSEPTPLQTLRDTEARKGPSVSIGDREFHTMTVDREATDKNYKWKLFSDVPWEERLPLHRIHNVPFAMLPMILHGDTIIGRLGTGENALERNDEIVECDSSEILDAEFDVNYYVADVYTDFSWLPSEDAIVKHCHDTSLIRFLTQREIPIWATILSHARSRWPEDHEISYINESLGLLESFYVRFPNAVSELAITFLHSFVHELLDIGAVAQCKLCRRIMRPRKGKKYCSLRSDGRECGKSARNRRYYEKNHDAIRDRSRREMRLTRKFLKEIAAKTRTE